MAGTGTTKLSETVKSPRKVRETNMLLQLSVKHSVFLFIKISQCWPNYRLCKAGKG